MRDAKEDLTSNCMEADVKKTKGLRVLVTLALAGAALTGLGAAFHDTPEAGVQAGMVLPGQLTPVVVTKTTQPPLRQTNPFRW